ncbi:hypothetical protein SOM12_03770 [Flavobacterium sp. CFBP9031]|uniref:hypothetical protein n=1 Tax=Flavobacterium sp. CFBP9031 TaxID=3096538 RepID=UPI002A699E40|nr:hypothetical protein [Flavobacterium sp. CFBP9031]MDY0986518.1 hypothetical protein [Flavobacterium sp. CFBP9031]
MTKISIIKKIQLGGERSFPIESPDSEVYFNFYCGNGGIKHEAIISFKNSNFLSSLIETGLITNHDLAQNNIVKLEYLEDQNAVFSFRYQICNFKDCQNTYLLIFDVHENRGYYGFFIHGVLQIEKIIIE